MVKAILKNRNLMLLFCYTLLLMTAVMGRVGVMVYFYMYCVQNTAMMGILMIIPNIVGIDVYKRQDHTGRDPETGIFCI